MQKPIIGITSGVIYNFYYPTLPPVHGQRHTFVDAVVRAGGVPILLPLAKDESVIKEMFHLVDGLLLSGGNDINPKMYGEEPKKGKLEDVSDLRDKVDKQFLDCAYEKNIPIFAICRGMQFINVYHGGSLYQDITSDLPGAIDHMSSVKDLEHEAHLIQIDKNSKLYDIMETDEMYTNTLHHQAIKELGQGLKVTARSDHDDIVEAIESDDNRFIIGIQGHPESMGRVTPAWGKLFKAFVAASSKN